MLSFLQYLIAFTIATSNLVRPGLAAAPPDPDLGGIVLTLSAFGLLWSTWGLLLARRIDPESPRSLTVFLRLVGAGRIVALAVFWFTCDALHAWALPNALGIERWVLVPHLVRLAPFAALIALLRLGLHPVGARLRAEPPGALATLKIELESALLPLAPLVLVVGGFDLLGLADPATRLGAVAVVLTQLPLAQAALCLGLLLLSILLMPFVLRLTLRARPLEPGPLRTRLETYARSVRLQAREILIWPTDGEQMNAAVVGAFPRFRYVFLTDALVERLGPDEIEAVFAHEAGHARRGHVLLFFGFTTVLVLLSVLPHALGETVASVFTGLDPLVRGLLTVLVWLGVIFGWVSRRFEQEADVFGIDTVPFPPAEDGSPRDPAEHPFARALETIAEEAGGIREITGWRHFSIADRVGFVRDYLTDPAVRTRYRRSIRLLRGTLISVIALSVLLALAYVPRELEAVASVWKRAQDPDAALLEPLRAATTPAPAAVRARQLVLAARLAQKAGRPDRALRWLRTAASLSPADPYVLDDYARALEEAGRPRGAEIAWRDLLALADVPPDLRERAEAALGSRARAGD